MNPLTFTEIHFGSDAYREECLLRNAVLRMPIGLSLYAEDLSQEQHQMHFGMYEEGVLIACAIAVALTQTDAKIRQMAVSFEHQGRGHGRRILQRLENHLETCGFVRSSLHARRTAIGFYEKLHYTKVGDEFMEVGIPHVQMEKRLTRRWS